MLVQDHSEANLLNAIKSINFNATNAKQTIYNHRAPRLTHDIRPLNKKAAILIPDLNEFKSVN